MAQKSSKVSDDTDEAKARLERSRKFVTDMADRAIQLRSKEREFHGLQREFIYAQKQMTSDYEKSKDVKHPRDLGAAREEILRGFLKNSGYLPSRFAVSDKSIRVSSPSGHISNEIDMLLYDPRESITLMSREDVYEVFPIETVHGVIQVKSRLNKKEIAEGLENLASFKILDRPLPRPTGGFQVIGGAPKETLGFGLLFAYDSDLSWQQIVDEITAFCSKRPSRLWPNGVFILSKGFFLPGAEGFSTFSNNKIAEIHDFILHGRPDLDGSLLFGFYSALLWLLRNTPTHPPEVEKYFQLPLVAERNSYRFSFGNFGEIARCAKHGDYQRRISPTNLQKVISFCLNASPINWVKATHLAYGNPEDEEAYKRQPGEVRIYNPNNLSLTDALTAEETFESGTVRVLAYDAIEAAGMAILVPYYYSVTEHIISTCPKCLSTAQRRSQKGPGGTA